MGGASLDGNLAGIGARLAGLAERVAGDAALLRRRRYLNTTCQLDMGGQSVLLRIIDGRIAEVRLPMSESPALFLSYLEPVLAEIAARG